MKRFLLIAIGCLLPVTALAGVNIDNYGFDCTGFVYCHSPLNAVTGIATKLIAWIGAFIVALAVVSFFYGALRMAVSRGEEGKEIGKKAMIYASLGLAAALLTRMILQFICGYLYYVGGTPAGCPTSFFFF